MGTARGFVGCSWSRRLGWSSASACVGVRQTRWHLGPYKLRVCSPQSSSGPSERLRMLGFELPLHPEWCCLEPSVPP